MDSVELAGRTVQRSPWIFLWGHLLRANPRRGLDDVEELKHRDLPIAVGVEELEADLVEFHVGG